MSDFVYPDDLRYTGEHEWVRVTVGAQVKVGITAFAQDALGDVVYVSLPGVGDHLTAGDACGEVESTKSVSDLYSPLSGTVTEVNTVLDETPELVNTDPYGAGWLFKIKPSNAAEMDTLLDEAAYLAQAG